MDDQPLKSSAKVLIQVGTISRATNWDGLGEAYGGARSRSSMSWPQALAAGGVKSDVTISLANGGILTCWRSAARCRRLRQRQGGGGGYEGGKVRVVRLPDASVCRGLHPLSARAGAGDGELSGGFALPRCRRRTPMSAQRRPERGQQQRGDGSRSRPTTLLQVAERAGVSKSTAAIVLSGRAAACRISAPCVERVRAAARAIGYQGNYHARTLSTGKASTLGLTMVGGDRGGVGSAFWGAISDGIESAARSSGYDLLLLGGEGGDAAIAHATSRLETRRIDALIVLRLLFYRLPGELMRSRLPVVTIGGRKPEPFPDVQLDAAPGIAAAVAHLAEPGHRCLLWITLARDGRVVLPERRAATRPRDGRAVAHEVELRELDGNDRRPDEVVVRFQELLGPMALPVGATAVIFARMIRMALAAQRPRSARGLSLPRDLSIIGFDDLYAALASPPLSTISHSLPDLGAAAVALAVSLLEGGRPPSLTLVPARFVARASTVAPPGDPSSRAHSHPGEGMRMG